MSKISETSHSITLTPEVLEKLAGQVKFETTDALQQFVADAINSYLHLGRLHQSGGEFLFASDGRETPIVLHFPFQER